LLFRDDFVEEAAFEVAGLRWKAGRRTGNDHVITE